ncbi:TatD family hydrolase [Celerinatantimonas yamalensis]|uniref:TatD family hydrolase n=1 Tax=Celerinatantimonas yamalensis TaxID=559956 RepID=A0ABW9G879_9GAMM
MTKLAVIDTHCHLDFSPFSALESQLLHWQALGIERYVVPAIGPQNWQKLFALHAKHSQISIALGIHPCFPDGFGHLDTLRTHVAQAYHQIVAIGECGLDRRFANTMSEQCRVFECHLQLAAQYQLPLIIHSVRMNDEVYALLKRYSISTGGVIHAFQGSQVQAQRFIEQGFKLGVGGAITWPRGIKLQDVLATLPLEALVLETDAPDMPLYGMHKGDNTPAALFAILAKLSDLFSKNEIFLSEIFVNNSYSIFWPNEYKGAIAN